MPDPVAPTPEVGPQSNDAAAQPQAAREQIYARYYGSVQPVTPPSAEPPAQGEPPTDPALQAATPPPAATETAPAVEPTQPAEPAQPPAAPSADLAATIAQVVESKLTEALARFSPAAPPPAAPPEPAAPVAPEDWLSLLQQGKRDEAMQALTAQVAGAAKQQSIQEALELFRVETDITSFVNDLRGKNPDLVPLEDLISVRAAQRLEATKAKGLIRSTADYVREYKAAVNAAAEDAKQLVQQIRAAGKQEAMTTKSQVVAASVVPPKAVEANRGAAAQPPAEPDISAQSYLARRMALSAQRRGL
jgi:hypothetical protein